ncbi:hypothetical protein [Pelagerythrobacter sp.]|uniref:hypothetical protein n=1 Tax=Pelagerythrobacter sp. TaxID=2800702 RepID=UPI0035B1A470
MTEKLAQNVASASRVGPSSFDGHDWLVIFNLGSSTALFLIALLFSVDLGKRIYVNRRRDGWDHPVTVFRVVLLLLSAGIVLRNAARAAVLWKWDPSDPFGTSFTLTVQRFVDPVADLLQLSAIALAIVTAPTLINQLRKVPWLVPIRQSLPELMRPATLAAMSFVAAFGVVVTR